MLESLLIVSLLIYYSIVIILFGMYLIKECNKQNRIGDLEMTSVLKIGNLRLDMGGMSHVLGIQNTEKGVSTYLKYATYQSKFR